MSVFILSQAKFELAYISLHFVNPPNCTQHSHIGLVEFVMCLIND